MEFSLQAALCRNPIAEVGSSAFKLPLLLCRLKPELHATPWCIFKSVGFGVQPWAAPACVQAKLPASFPDSSGKIQRRVNQIIYW